MITRRLLLSISGALASVLALASPSGMRHQILDGPGPIQVILPADLRAGDHISGSLIGDSLSKVRLLGVDGEWSPGSFKFRVPDYAASLGLTVEMAQGNETISRDLIASLPSPTLSDILGNFTPQVPGAVIWGKPLTIQGAFDGDASNTRVSFNGIKVVPLAESPRNAIVMIPSGTGGVCKFRLQEGEASVETDLRILLGQVDIANPRILTGERTKARLLLTGLRGLEQPLTVFVNTTNPGIVQMEGGPMQSVHIVPTEVSADGGWTKDLGILGVVPGEYAVQMRFPAPEAPRQPSFSLNWIDFPGNWPNNRDIVLKARANPLSQKPSAVRFTVSRVEGGSQFSFAAKSETDGVWSATLPSRTFMPGYYMVNAEASGANGASQRLTRAVKIGNAAETPNFPGYGGGDLPKRLTTIGAQFNLGIQATYGRVEDYWNNADAKRRAAEDARRAAEEAWDEADKMREQAKALADIDRRLANALPAAAAKMKGLAEEIRALGNSTGNATKADLEAKVAAAQNTLAACKENCGALKQKISELDAEIVNLEKQLTELAADIQKLLLADGWTGRAEFDKEQGVLRWGFLGPDDQSNKVGNNTNPETLKLNEMEKKGRVLLKRLKQAKAERDKAKQDLVECEERCRIAEDAVRAARAASAAEDERASKAAELHDECEKIKALVNRLRKTLEDHPELAGALQKEMDGLLKKCPETPEEVQDWKDRLEKLMAAKAVLEGKLEETADAKKAEGDAKSEEAKAADAEARALADAAYEEQQRLAQLERDRRAAENKAVADAAAAKRARDKAAAAEEERMKAEFVKWLEDAVKNGWLDDSDLERILQDAAAKAVDIAGVAGSAAGEAVKSSMKGGSRGAITRAGLFEGIFQLYATIFYWVLDGELRGAIDRLRPAFNNKEFQEILADIALNGKGKTFGRVDGRGKSYFWVKKNGKTIVYRVSRDGGVEVIGMA